MARSVIRGSLIGAVFFFNVCVSCASATYPWNFGLNFGMYYPSLANDSYVQIYDKDGCFQYDIKAGMSLLHENLYFNFGFLNMSKSGETVYMPPVNGEWFRTGNDSKLEIRNIYLEASYISDISSKFLLHISPSFGYFTLDETIEATSEQKAIGMSSKESSEDGLSLKLKAGLMYKIYEFLTAGSLCVNFDAGYEFVPGILGKSGISKYYGEDNFGGPFIAIGISFFSDL
ncbi:hypothetical protein JXA40_12750 [bacterium]|nr:hypothetical protein [candidate division CSSED10-310 bacterium]